MIYLIDDNRQDMRRKSMNIHYVDDNEYSDILTSINQLIMGKDLSYLESADCLLVHSTTVDCDENGEYLSSTQNVRTIIESLSDYGSKIPLVSFSNKMNESEQITFRPPSYLEMRKTIFYSKLYDFLENYRRNKVVELRLIAYGKNYLAEELRPYTKLIIESVAHELFKLTFIKQLIWLQKFHELSGLDISYQGLSDDLEDNPITVSTFINKISSIQDSILRYGKNIHSWKG